MYALQIKKSSRICVFFFSREFPLFREKEKRREKERKERKKKKGKQMTRSKRRRVETRPAESALCQSISP